MSKRAWGAVVAVAGLLVASFFALANADISRIVGIAIGLLMLILALLYLVMRRRKSPVPVRPRALRLIDSDGHERSTFDVGESLTVQVSGLRPSTVHDLVLLESEGDALLVSRAMSNREGLIERATIWPQMGFEDLRLDRAYTVEESQEIWIGRELRVQVQLGGHVLMESGFRFADVFERPLLLSTGPEGVICNGFEVGTQDAVVSGYNIPFEGRARVFIVMRQHDWQPSNPIAPVTLAGGRSAIADVEVDGGRFETRLARADELEPGAYDFIVRQLRYGYEDDDDLRLRLSDIVTRAVTGLVVRQEFMSSKFALGGCSNTLPISGRHIFGAPYFQYTDTFEVGEEVRGALDPAALDPNLVGKMVALYVINHRPSGQWATNQNLQHLTQLGGNAAVQSFKTQAGCINWNDLLLWSTPGIIDVGEYDIVADFGNNTPDTSAFVSDAKYDQPLDIIDGYTLAGFRIVQDPGIYTPFLYYGSLSYNENTQGSHTVTNHYGNEFSVPLKAMVRFPANISGATAVSEISPNQTSYPLVVIVHGQGHDYMDYDYLLNHWAMNGFIAASIYLTNANGKMTHVDRASMLFKHLEILKTMFGTKADNNIGIMGHSRGGEGVAVAPRMNFQQELPHAINAVISLAPTDQYTDETIGGDWATPYLVVYGAMDGDVAGGSGKPWNTGFALFDRANGKPKSMVFVYSATHNRFTETSDADYSSWKLGANDRAIILERGTHQAIAMGYMTAFFHQELNGDTRWEGLFRGEWIPASVRQAEGGAVNLYVQYSDTNKTVIDDFEGAHSATSWASRADGGTVDHGGTLPDTPLEDELYDIDTHSPHDTSGLLLRWDGLADKIEFSLNNLNASNYAALSFRVTQMVDSQYNPADQAQDLYVTLRDGTLPTPKSRSIKVCKFAEIPAPQKRDLNQFTKSAMCTVRIPLHAFTIEVLNTERVDITNLTAVVFDFKAKAAGQIEIDSVEFTM